jgi:hypothetical protein
MEITAELVRAQDIQARVASLCDRLQEALQSVERPPSLWCRDCIVLVYWVRAVGSSTARDEDAKGVLRCTRTMVSALFYSFQEVRPRVNLERPKQAAASLMSALDETLCDAQDVCLI